MQHRAITHTAMTEQRNERGFTLLEALIALAIVAMVITTCLAIRTGALIDATEARNWRVAREIAEEVLSELQAGARSDPVDYNMAPTTVPRLKDVEGWTYQIVIGEDRIGSREGDMESESETADDRSGSRLREWQRERDDLRKARSKGMSYYDYQEQTQLEEEERMASEDEPPSEDETEQVAVFVYFPNVRDNGNDRSFFVLKATVSTLAIQGMTPEEAESAAEASGTSETSEIGELGR